VLGGVPVAAGAEVVRRRAEGGEVIFLQTDRVTLYHDVAENVYPMLEPGFSLGILDPPYAVGIDTWDKMGLDGLAGWMAPHLEGVTRLMAPPASLYVWGTPASWARLDPGIRALGWTFRSLIVWDKVITATMLQPNAWPDTTEVCGFYEIGKPSVPLKDEFGRKNRCGNTCWISNVWRYSSTGQQWRAERIRGEVEKGRTKTEPNKAVPLHPCQKPLLFSERMIRASSRPGDRILAPFGGTCREAVVCHQLPPNEARTCVSVEPDIKYLEAVRGSFILDTRPTQKGQVGLFNTEST
jgi:DNA modification methylase